MTAIGRLPIVVITANNPTFSEENLRRVARIRIDSETEDPSKLPASAFRHRQIAWVAANRFQLQAAARAIIQRWDGLAAKRIDSDEGWGSFEEWFELMGGICESSGWLGLGENRTAGMVVDERERRWGDLLETWISWTRDGLHIHAGIRVRDLVAWADELDGFWSERELRSKAAVMGRMLMARRDQVFRGWKITRKNNAHNISEWGLVELNNRNNETHDAKV